MKRILMHSELESCSSMPDQCCTSVEIKTVYIIKNGPANNKNEQMVEVIAFRSSSRADRDQEAVIASV